MHRFTAAGPASLLLLVVLCSGSVQAETSHERVRDTLLLQPLAWLALQHDSYLIEVNNRQPPFTLAAVDESAWSSRVAADGTLSPAPLDKASLQAAASPAPSALWILGTSLIGLAAVSRRRTLPVFSPA